MASLKCQILSPCFTQHFQHFYGGTFAPAGAHTQKIESKFAVWWCCFSARLQNVIAVWKTDPSHQQQQQSDQSGWFGELGNWSRHGGRPPTLSHSSRLWSEHSTSLHVMYSAIGFNRLYCLCLCHFHLTSFAWLQFLSGDCWPKHVLLGSPLAFDLLHYRSR